MSAIKVYDPPMCCSTGVCGPDGDDELAQFAGALEWAKKNGVSVDRFNLGHQPAEFATNADIKNLIASDGVDVLPVVVIDGDIVTKGGYPSRTDLASKLGLSDSDAGGGVEATSCCGPNDAAEKTSSCC